MAKIATLAAGPQAVRQFVLESIGGVAFDFRVPVGPGYEIART